MNRAATVRPDVIFVIDDDSKVLESTKRILESEGYGVRTAQDPPEAIKLYETHWQEINLVLLDFLMHIMRGDEVFERLRQINPNVRVIMITGCDDDAAQKMFEKGLRGFLQKPYSPQELIDRVRAEAGSCQIAQTVLKKS
jgi:two-component system, cell cycle sensor histidine kinase and response regulator CckA